MRSCRRWTLGAALALAVAVLIPPAGAGQGPPAGRHGALALRVVSSPPELVSGGAARVEVTVPARVARADVTVELNGTDVTAAFGPDPAGHHHLEGVLTDLPLGESTVAVRVRGPGKARPNRVELAIVNHPITGPMFSGPQQEVFLCATNDHLGRAMLGAIDDQNAIDDQKTCSVKTRVG